MSLKKYHPCDVSHYDQFEYVCLKDKKVFCLKCWYKFQHFRYCQSTRCGQYSKIAHTALNRALQYKNSKLLESLCGQKDTFQQLRTRFLQLNFQVTQIVKEFVQQKMPLLFWSMINELVKDKVPPLQLNGYHKFDSVCTDMIKIIKSTDPKLRHENLESAIGAYYDINHQIEGDMNLFRTEGYPKKNGREEQIHELFEKVKGELMDMLSTTKKNIRKSIDDQLQRVTLKINSKVKYRGVFFQKVPQKECFRKRQEYPYINTLAQQYSRLTNEQNQLYNGYHLNLSELQSCPEQLLQVSKCFLKDRLFSIYENINTVKSVFPYKFAYPISTTLSNDQQYQQLLIDMERAMIETTQSPNPFYCSLNLIVIGRELIVIRFYNHPKFCYSRKIYNYSKSRTKYYENLMQKLDLKGVATRNNATPDLIEFSEELSQTELVYCHFRTAYETIFQTPNEQLVFQGETVMANRGAEQFAQIVQKWRSTAQIDLNFNRPLTEMIRFFV